MRTVCCVAICVLVGQHPMCSFFFCQIAEIARAISWSVNYLMRHTWSRETIAQTQFSVSELA